MVRWGNDGNGGLEGRGRQSWTGNKGDGRGRGGIKENEEMEENIRGMSGSKSREKKEMQLEEQALKLERKEN